MSPSSIRWCLFGFAGLAAGCTSVQTRMYYAAADVDSNQPIVTLYRVTVTGTSTNSKSTLAQGFYSADALRAFSGEAPKVGEAATGTPPATIGSYKVERGKAGWEMRSPDSLLTMVYGPDSKAISAVIGNYMKSDKLGTQLGALLAKATSGEAISASADLAVQKTQLKQTRDTLGVRVEALANSIDLTTEPSPEELMQKLVDAAQAIANGLGASETFTGATTQDAITAANTFWKSAKAATP